VFLWQDSPIIEIGVYTPIRGLSTLFFKIQACHRLLRQFLGLVS
jgi:hypothetical protein